MAESLYVCLFSNGHIKVGRSIEPGSRIAAHADRVACLGVELSDKLIVECVGQAGPRELLLIRRCTEAAESRYQNEWFTGLDFLSVCEWAGQAARLELSDPDPYENTFGHRLTAARRANSLTQREIAGWFDLTKAAVSKWETNECSPSINQLRVLCERLGVSADHLVCGVPHTA
jgi:DNA-binding XRE family transcriptional regulator